MKDGWELKTLGDVCKTGAGGTPLKEHKDYYEGGNIPWLLSGEVSQGNIYSATNFITEKGLKNSSARLFPINTVLVAMYGATAGQVGILRFEACTNQAVCGILPNKHILPEFLYYCFLSKKDELVAQAVGGAQPNISQIKIKNTRIPIPPLPEQQRIVSILDEAFSVIDKAKANAEKNLQNAKELFECYLTSVFANKGEGWVEKRLGEICDYDKASNVQKDIPYVGLEDIQSNTGKLIGPTSPRTVKSLTFHFNTEHVLYGRLRPYLNKVFLPNFEGHCSTEIFPIKPKSELLDRRFLFRWLMLKETVDRINATWTGATLPRANMNAVLDFKLWIPSISTQRSISMKTDDIAQKLDFLGTINHKKLADLEELKKSILQKTFSGELTSTKAIAV
jgi:type I restriction enzyme S subunit